MKPFGDGGTASQWGYDLEFIIGWLESMISDEDDGSQDKHKFARLARAEDALDALNEVNEWTPILTKYYSKRINTPKP